MHIARYNKTKTALSDRPNKNGSQQKNHNLKPFEHNGTLQKWQVPNTPSKIDKNDNTHKNLCLTKMVHLAKKCPRLSDFQTGIS